ncbi:MFS transporter [Paenibacillus radicis (ex Xue et al. 2023)]|uniref:Glycoside-pentoside-hexuronide (GPH):cation symporter n=1 Tax=Paenibacillus radicis (ex Xue et al. 2023) TaxID=2972489 RepID=A0ABT1YTK4_9BACL|nr:glycoside-pentoside-hexuronide (GPH):cation symporter [Paenibacillus radicis (ex Xue et al. 2023)]MCR8636520.1 glycoside-pentoside-hexuronide (GPH):cation symporter [Paenibacillus radicis (ex Xue et al. 2023)]
MSHIANLKTAETVATAMQIRKFGMRDKLGYMFGDFGNDFFFILVSSFLMVYYTDIFHISAATVGILFLIARLWDAFADVTWGRFIDTRKPGKHGKFKPWIYRMSFPLVVSGVLMFVKIPGMSDGFYLAYAFVTYLVWGTLYSTVNIPYGSMASVITSDPVERTALSTFRTMGAMLASLVINVAGPLLVFKDNKADANGFLTASILFGILSISCYIACYKLSTERITANVEEDKKFSMTTTLRAFLKNKPLLSILSASLIFMMCTMLIGAVNVYLFKDFFGSAAALSLVGIVQVAAAFIAIPLAKPLVAKFGKKETAAVGMSLAAVVYILLYFFPHLSAAQFIAVSAVGMFGYAFFNIVVWAFVTDVIDYHEYLTGLREDGTVYSIYAFSRKVGQAIAGGVGGVALAAVGYDAARHVQTQGALDGIYALGTLVPGIIYGVIFLILVFLYPLTKQRTNELADQLADKRIV